MLQLAPTTDDRFRNRTSPIARAIAMLNVIHLEWSKLCVDGDEKRYNDLQDEGWTLARKIIAMPARDQEDILRKIAAAGFLMDRRSDQDPLATWQFKPTGYFCDDAGGSLLMSIRDDLNRMKGKI